MEGRCTECGCNNVALHHYLNYLCYDCYEKLFQNSVEPNDKVKLDPLEEEPDFELKSAIADVQLAIDKHIFVKTGENRHYLRIEQPKRVVFDPDCRVKDYDKLILFLLENMYIYEDAKGFDKVKYMFKEVGE